MKTILFEILKKIVDFNYKRVLKRIKSKSKINIVFLVSENQKWSYDSLFNELKNNDKFNVKILLTYPKDLKLNSTEKKKFLDENYKFYSKIDSNVELLYKNNKYCSLKKFNPDIVFYEQQWGLPRIYKPYLVSFYALTYFSCYGIQLFDFKEDYTKNFHYFLYKYLVDFKENFLRFKKYNKKYIKNCIVTGYPKLDYFIDNKKKNYSDKTTIIYAPHHSFNSGLNTATFDKNGEFILNYAIKTKDSINWIFKPHPRLKQALLDNNIMSKDKIENYYSQWEKIGTIFNFGNYFDLFLNSDILITDCCSYLGEYYYINNTVIRLVNNNAIKLNKLGENITKNYYNVFDKNKLIDTINKAIQEKNQPESRAVKIKSSKIILESLLNEFR